MTCSDDRFFQAGTAQTAQGHMRITTKEGTP